jgi:transposase-like protein
MVAALVRTIFAQATQADAGGQLQSVSEQLCARFPAAATLLADAAEDVLAYMAFPTEKLAATPLDQPIGAVEPRAGLAL